MSEAKDFDYDAMIEDAMRGVVRDVLARAAAHGLAGDHHFYISFLTQAPGVEMSPRLRAQYPKDITVVLQHQFWNLEAGKDAFSVELAFSGARERLVAPYAALTGFADPSVKFAVKFGAKAAAPGGARPKPPARASGGDKPGGDTPGGDKPAAEKSAAEKIVSLDHFRNKK